MKVEEHLLNDIKPLDTNAVVGATLDLMEELKFCHLPVLHKGKYVGLIGEDDLLDIQDEADVLEKHLHVLKAYSLLISDHLFNAMRVVGEGNLSLLPVLNNQGKYVGYLSPLELTHDLGRQLTFSEAGSVVVLNVGIRDYQLSQLSQIVESDDARITGMLIKNNGIDFIRVALKINRRDISRILKSLERYDYEVVEVYHNSIFDNTAADRYEALMKYINI